MSNIQLNKLLKSDDVYSAKRYGRQSWIVVSYSLTSKYDP